MGFKDVLEELECAIVLRDSKLGIVFTFPHEVCVCFERLVALST
jgi:hypothetical protein